MAKQKVRRPRDLANNVLASIVGAIVLTAALVWAQPWIEPDRLALLLLASALVVSLVWAFIAGWRLSVSRLPLPEPPKQKTATENAQREAFRTLKSEITAVFYARMVPATDALKAMITAVDRALSGQSPGGALAGSLLTTYAVGSVNSSGSDLKRMLDDPFPNLKSTALKEVLFDKEFETTTADDFGFRLFIHYADYRNAIGWLQHAAAICCGPITSVDGYDEWIRLDRDLASRLRDVYAKPELEGYRGDLEEAIKQWSNDTIWV